MSYFTGEPATNIEQTVLAALQSYLRAKFALAPHQAKFASWGGPGVSIDPDSDFGANARGAANAFSKKPWVYLEIADRQTERWGKSVDGVFRDGTRHLIQISAEVLTSDSCLPAERPLKDALMQLVRDGYHDLWAAGLEEIEIKGGQSSNPRPNRINPHTISFVTYTLTS